MTTCFRCGSTWSGLRIEHCTVCHETFTGAQPGDMHRIGPHWPPGLRRCRSVAEMAELGMRRNARGHWTTGKVYQRYAAAAEIDEEVVEARSPHLGPAGPLQNERAVVEEPEVVEAVVEGGEALVEPHLELADGHGRPAGGLPRPLGGPNTVEVGGMCHRGAGRPSDRDCGGREVSHPDCVGDNHVCAEPSGRVCVEPGCSEPAGTRWGPLWCPEHDRERLDRISASLNGLIDEFEGGVR